MSRWTLFKCEHCAKEWRGKPLVEATVYREPNVGPPITSIELYRFPDRRIPYDFCSNQCLLEFLKQITK